MINNKHLSLVLLKMKCQLNKRCWQQTDSYPAEAWNFFSEGDRVETYRRAFINGSFFSCAKMCTSKLKNSYTVQYTDASGRIQFGEIQKFFLIKTHHVAIVTKLVQIRSLASGVTSSSDEFNDFVIQDLYSTIWQWPEDDRIYFVYHCLK